MVEDGVAAAAGILTTFLSHDTVARAVLALEPGKATTVGVTLGRLCQGVPREQAEAVVQALVAHEQIARLLLEMEPTKAAGVGTTLGNLVRGVVTGMSGSPEGTPSQA